jgi:uncharacterized protein
MTAETLNNYSAKDLAQMAKRRGVHGWHAMRKDQLVQALVRLARGKAARKRHALKSTRPIAAGRTRPAVATAKARSAKANSAKGSLPIAARKPVAPTADRLQHQPAQAVAPVARMQDPAVARRLLMAKAKQTMHKDLSSSKSKENGSVRDRLVVMVRGPFWLHAYWELSRQGVSRAQAALGEQWHAAKAVLRLYEVSAGATTSAAETPVRDVEIHGGVNNWYIDVLEPPRSFRVDIGYRAPNGRFFVLARSNVVSTPKAAASDEIDENWSEVAANFDKIYSMSGGYAAEGPSTELQELFEERLRRPMGSPLVTQFAGVEGLLPKKRGFSFEVDAELIVFGCTEPQAHVTLQGEPVKLRPDGTFTVRFSLPNSRQVIPAVACSRDGFEQRTVVLAVERNTKVMEPLLRDGSELL